MEFRRLNAMSLSLPLDGCESLEVGGAPGAARHRPRAHGPSILLFSDCPEEHHEAFPVNGKNLHLRLSKVEKLFLSRPDDCPRNRLTKSAYPKTLSGCPLYNDRGRPAPGKFPILRLSLEDRRAEKVVLAARKNHPLEIGRSTPLLIVSPNF